jgi:hypothetical protein
VACSAEACPRIPEIAMKGMGKHDGSRAPMRVPILATTFAQSMSALHPKATVCCAAAK